jgi:hypothetical protein
MTRRTRQPVPVVLTREQEIEKAVNDRWTSRFVDSPIPMPTWTFQVGEQVSIGMLQNVRVIGLYHEGRVIAIQYTDMPTRDRAFEVERIGAWWWFDVFPKHPKNEGVMFSVRNHWRVYINSQLDSLINDALCNEYRDNTDYQRGYVWQQSDKDALIDSIFKGREIGKFVFIRYPYPDNYVEVLDGKQRINALFEFCTSKFPYRGIYWHDLSAADRRTFETIQVQHVLLHGEKYTRAQLLEIFLDVNTGGVPQSEEHLNKVRAMLDAERNKP